MLSTTNLVLLVLLVASNLGWWIHNRGLKGVISDLNDAKNQAQKAATKIKG